MRATRLPPRPATPSRPLRPAHGRSRSRRSTTSDSASTMTRTFVVDDTLGFLRVPRAGGRPAVGRLDRASRGGCSGRRASFVTVHDAAGRVVRRGLAPATQLEPGDQAVTWDGLGDGRKASGRRLHRARRRAEQPRLVHPGCADHAARGAIARVGLTSGTAGLRSDARLAFRDARRQRPDRDHRGRHRRDRGPRPVRRVRADAGRRGVPGGQRGRDGLCGRRRGGRFRRPVGDALRLRVRDRFPAYVAMATAGTVGYLSGDRAAGRSATTSAGRGSSGTGGGST